MAPTTLTWQAAEGANEGTWITTIDLSIPFIKAAAANLTVKITNVESADQGGLCSSSELGLDVGAGSKRMKVVNKLTVIEASTNADVGARPAETKGLTLSMTGALRREIADNYLSSSPGAASRWNFADLQELAFPRPRGAARRRRRRAVFASERRVAEMTATELRDIITSP